MEINKFDNKSPSSIMSGDYNSLFTNHETTPKDKTFIKSSLTKIPTRKLQSERAPDTVWSHTSEHRLTDTERTNHHRQLITTEPICLNLNKTLLTARWPPYVVASWMALLLVTHLLHGTLCVLTTLLPHFRRICQQFHRWTEESWQTENSTRLYPLMLACSTACLYVTYCGMYALYAVVRWATEPLCSDSAVRNEDRVSGKESRVNITC